MSSQNDRLKLLTEEYAVVSRDYRESLLKYSAAFFSAEIAVTGFLLQNGTTRQILHYGRVKYVIMAAVGCAFLAVAGIVLYKKVNSLYNQKMMHEAHYGFFKDNPGLLPGLEEIDSKRKAALKAAFKFADWLPDILLLSESALVIGMLLAAIAAMKIIAKI